ncbi:MAG: hypothetical protein KAJ07_04455 [Planctomycetes bacterium]|nr:hypothetical protein [Planctomycetota bacterium]
MKKLTLIAFFAAIFISPALGGSVTIEPLDPDKGKLLVTYLEGYNLKAGTKEFLFGGALPSADGKPDVHSVIDVNTKQKFMAKAIPHKKDDKTISGRYRILVRLKEPLAKNTKFSIQAKYAVFDNDLCYVNDDGLWVAKWLTSYACKFIAPRGHIPVFTSLPVMVSEYYGRIHLLQGPLFIKNNNKALYRRTLVFKTKSLPTKETKTKSK